MPAKKTSKKDATSDAKPKLSAEESILKEIASINKFGNVRLASQRVRPVSVISTGEEELDRIITPSIYEEQGVGGIPCGFLCEFYGPTGGGKSSLCMNLCASVHKEKNNAYWVDAEGSFVEEWAKIRGMDLDRTGISDTGLSGEQYIKEIIHVAESGKFKIVVVDSMTALQPKNLKFGDLEEDPRVGAKALMISRAAPNLIGAAKKGNCAIVFVNQIRYKIGIKYGNPETTPGGEALKFAASLRLRLSQLSSSEGRGIIKDGEEIGIRSNVQVTKSRFGPPLRETVVSFYYTSERPHPLDMILDMALSSKIIKTRTRTKDNERVQHFTLDGNEELKGIPGIDTFKYELVQRPDLIKDIVRRLKEETKKTIDPEVAKYADSVVQSESPLADEKEAQ